MLSDIGLHTLTNRAKPHRLNFLYFIPDKKRKVGSDTYISLNTSRKSRHNLTLQQYFYANNAFSLSLFPRANRE